MEGRSPVGKALASVLDTRDVTSCKPAKSCTNLCLRFMHVMLHLYI